MNLLPAICILYSVQTMIQKCFPKWSGFHSSTPLVSLLVWPYSQHHMVNLVTCFEYYQSNHFFIKGRYSSSKYGFLLPAKIAWITQESPSFIMPVILLLTTSSAFWNSTVNKLLLTGFIIHYVNR